MRERKDKDKTTKLENRFSIELSKSQSIIPQKQSMSISSYRSRNGIACYTKKGMSLMKKIKSLTIKAQSKTFKKN